MILILIYKNRLVEWLGYVDWIGSDRIRLWLGSIRLTQGYPYRRWTNYSNPDIYLEPPSPQISLLLMFSKHGREWTKQIKPRRTKMETWDKNIEIQGERGDFNIMHLGFDEFVHLPSGVSIFTSFATHAFSSGQATWHQLLLQLMTPPLWAIRVDDEAHCSLHII